MSSELSPTVAAYFRAMNGHDADAFTACFSDEALVNDAGRDITGLAAIRSWCERDIVEPEVVVDVVGATEGPGETIVTTKVDGNFDKSGLPDPLFLDHHITVEGGKIVGLTIRLSGG